MPSDALPNDSSFGVPIGYLPVYGPPTYKQFMDAYYAAEMERHYGPPPARNVTCGACSGRGYLEVECCNGSSGCSCGGGLVFMGDCRDCHGTGRNPTNPGASLRMIEAAAEAGRGYLGSGARW